MLVLQAVLAVIIVIGLELHDEEGDVSPADILAPGIHHRGEPVGIDLVGDTDVGLALEPQDSAEGIFGGWTEHGVVHDHRLVHVIDLGVCSIVKVHVRAILEKFAAHPGLNHGTAPAGIDDAHRNVKGLGETGAEEVADRGEARTRRRIAFLPSARSIILRLGCTSLVYGHIPQALVLAGHGYFIQRAFDSSGECHLHIALAGTEPYLAYQDVRGLHGLSSAGGTDRLRFESRCGGLNQDLPMPFGIGAGTDGRLEPRSRDCDRRARRGGAPNARLCVLLQDHIVAQQG